jgi:hypothetical protein
MHHSKMADIFGQLPCVLGQVFAVTGGGLGPIVVEDHTFGNIYIGPRLCKQYVNTKMVEHIKALRNKKVNELMQALSKEDDVSGEVELTAATLFDRLPKILTVNVTTASMVASVKLLPSWRGMGVLQLEITQPNLDLLLSEPPAEPAPWIPTLDHANVHWVGSRNRVRCYYYDSIKSKARIKSMGVELGHDMPDAVKLAATRKVADELQQFYDNNHNRLNNLPEIECISTASFESSSDESEPVQKAARTDTDPESEG